MPGDGAGHQGHQATPARSLGSSRCSDARGFVDVDAFWKQFGSVIYGGGIRRHSRVDVSQILARFQERAVPSRRHT